MADIEMKAEMTRANGAKLYREEHGFYNITDEQAAAITAEITKHADHVKELRADQRKTPSEVLTAVMTCTGLPDLTITGATFDTFQKVMQSWGKIGDEIIRELEKQLRKA